MAKLTVKNVGPIREAEFEVKKHTVFIGPQGSGKSTLAKLIAIGGDKGIAMNGSKLSHQYEMQNLLKVHSSIVFKDINYEFILNSTQPEFKLTNNGEVLLKTIQGNQFIERINREISSDLLDFLQNKQFERDIFINSTQEERRKTLLKTLIVQKKIQALSDEIYTSNLVNIIDNNTVYIAAERTLIAVLSNAIWSLLNSDINFPKTITNLGRLFEETRNISDTLNIPFLGVKYKSDNGNDLIYHTPNDAIILAQSASGYQSIVPLLLIAEHQRQQSKCRFIIEEPELNLYPTAQKDLIYALMSGLDPDVEYQDAEWVITTHSPYVLSSFNTLMLAYKVAQKSDELRAEVEKIVPARCWINPDEFAAYYVDNGTVRSIMSEKTGLIADNELDDVSEDLAGEQDQLFALSRSVSRA